MKLEFLVRHYQEEHAGKVQLQWLTEGNEEPPEVVELHEGTTLLETKYAGERSFFVDKAGTYKVVGRWRSGKVNATNVVTITTGMIISNGWDGLTPEERKRERALRIQREAEALARRTLAAERTSEQPREALRPAAPPWLPLAILGILGVVALLAWVVWSWTHREVEVAQPAPTVSEEPKPAPPAAQVAQQGAADVVPGAEMSIGMEEAFRRVNDGTGAWIFVSNPSITTAARTHGIKALGLLDLRLKVAVTGIAQMRDGQPVRVFAWTNPEGGPSSQGRFVYVPHEFTDKPQAPAPVIPATMPQRAPQQQSQVAAASDDAGEASIGLEDAVQRISRGDGEWTFTTDGSITTAARVHGAAATTVRVAGIPTPVTGLAQLRNGRPFRVYVWANAAGRPDREGQFVYVPHQFSNEPHQ